MNDIAKNAPGTPARAPDWICLAATPVFAVMALVTGGSPDMAAMSMASPLNGMAAMYLLMSVFHSAPWLKRLRRISSQTRHK